MEDVGLFGLPIDTHRVLKVNVSYLPNRSCCEHCRASLLVSVDKIIVKRSHHFGFGATICAIYYN
jgi:hypothetical protein